MSFDDFIQYVRDNIIDYLLNYDIEHVKIENINKNNGVTYTALLIVEKEDTVFPTIYLEYYYHRYQSDLDLTAALKAIARDYTEAKRKIENVQEEIDMYGKKENIFIRIVNYEKNKELLKDCPYIPFLDLAITFRYLARNDEDGIASSLINNIQLEKMALSVDEMYDIARQNTKRLFPPVIRKMKDLLEEMTGKVFEQEMGIYVLSNERFINGATSLIYGEFIQEFSECLRRDMYILPSSIHEVLLVPVDDFSDKEELLEMVSDVNSNVLSDMEFLSDNVYFYDALTGDIHI